MLGVDAMPAAGAGQAAEDRRSPATALVADKQAVFALSTIRLTSLSLTLLSIGTAPSAAKTFSSPY
jgi:hypothetical protein